MGAGTGIAKDPTVRVGDEGEKASGKQLQSDWEESNPVLQIKYLLRTECLLRRLTWVGMGFRFRTKLSSQM